MTAADVQALRERFKREVCFPGGKAASCAACGRKPGPYAMLQAHHVLPRRDIEANGLAWGILDPDDLQRILWDPRNGMVVCAGPFSCHDRHTASFVTIPRSRTPLSAWKFAREIGGDPAIVRLEREYPDPPIDRVSVP